jgi:hypothetical protein
MQEHRRCATYGKVAHYAIMNKQLTTLQKPINKNQQTSCTYALSNESYPPKRNEQLQQRRAACFVLSVYTTFFYSTMPFLLRVMVFGLSKNFSRVRYRWKLAHTHTEQASQQSNYELFYSALYHHRSSNSVMILNIVKIKIIHYVFEPASN